MGWGLSVSTSADLPDVCLCLPVTLPATIMTSSVPTTVGGHMMYPSPHAVMYAPTSGLADGSLTVLNAFSQAPSTMQVSHSQVQEQGESGQGCRKEDHFLPHTRTHTHTHTHMSPLNSHAHAHTYPNQMLTHIPICIHTQMLAHTLEHPRTHAHLTHLDTHPWALTSETHPVNLCTYHHTSEIWKFLLSK